MTQRKKSNSSRDATAKSEVQSSNLSHAPTVGRSAALNSFTMAAAGAILGLAAACLIDYAFKKNTVVPSGPLLLTALPLDLRTHILCKSQCHQASSNELHRKEANARLATFRQSGRSAEDWPSFVEEVCVRLCGHDVNSGKRPMGRQYISAENLPTVHTYLSCSDSCQSQLAFVLKNESVDPVAAIAVLRQCGVVHVPLGHVGLDSGSVALIGSMLEAYNKLRSGARGSELRDSLLDLDHLREGRDEFWLPYETPFSNFDNMLQNSVAGEIIGRFYGNRTPVIDHVNVINAPHSGAAQQQPLHRDDAERSSRHLEFHVPLWLDGTLPFGMGPPRFCPCIHEHYASSDPVSEALVEYMISQEKCLDFNNTNWILNKAAVGAFQLWGTLYDSQVFHQGLENTSPHDRPVLVVAVSESFAAVKDRGYVDTIESISSAQLDAVAEFRRVDLAKSTTF